MTFLVVLERGESSWGAHVPDLPGCVAVAESREEVLTLIHEAIDLHLEDLREGGGAPPHPSSEAELVHVAAA